MSTVRMFETEQHARDAAAKLEQGGFRKESISVIGAMPGQEDDAVSAAIDQGRLSGSLRGSCVAALRRGRSIVTVDAPFGAEADAIDILEGAGAVDSGEVSRYSNYDPTPLSDMFGIPVLSNSRSSVQLSHRLTFPVRLSNKATPLSSMFGMKTLTAPWRNKTSSLGFPMLTKSGGPVFGVKLRTPKKGWNRSFGIGLLSSNATPLSSMFGMRTISRKKNR